MEVQTVPIELFVIVFFTLIAGFVFGVGVVCLFLYLLFKNRKRFDKIGDAAGRISELMDQTTSGNISHKRGNIKSLVNVIKRNLN